MPELVYDVKFRIDTSNVETVKSQMQQATSAPTTGGTAGFSASETAAKGLTKELKELRTETLTTAQQVGSLVNRLATATSGFTRFNDETEQLKAELSQLVSQGLAPGTQAFESLAQQTELSATGQLNAERTIKSLTGSVRTAEGALRRYTDAQSKSRQVATQGAYANELNAKSVSNLVSASLLAVGKVKDLSIQVRSLANSGVGTKQQFDRLGQSFSEQSQRVERYIEALRAVLSVEGLSVDQKRKLQNTINTLSGSLESAGESFRKYSAAQSENSTLALTAGESAQRLANNISSLVSSAGLAQAEFKDLTIQMSTLTNSGEGTEQQFNELGASIARQKQIVDDYVQSMRNALTTEGLSVDQKKKLQSAINSLSATTAKSTSAGSEQARRQAKSTADLISVSTLAQDELKDLSIQMVALANSGEGTEQQLEQLKNEFSKQLEVVERYIQLLRKASKAEGLSAAQKARLQKTINSLSQTSVRANSAIGAMSQQNLAVGHSSQLANKQLAIGNQLFFSLSDGIQDAAQFSQGFSVGMRAVGNNIGFTAELMAAFIARTAVMNGGIVTTTAVLNSLKASFLGVGGVILALNTAITLITVFSQKSAQAEKEVSRLAEVMKQLREQSQLDFGIRDQLEREADQIRQAIGLLRDLDNKRKESRMIYVDPSAEKSVLIRRREARKAVDEQAAAVELLIESFGFEEKSIEALEEKLKEVTDAQRVFTDSMGDSQLAFGVLFDNIEEGVKRALIDQELGLTRASSAISYQRERLENLIRSWTILVELGDDSLVPMLKRAKDALDELTEDDDEETNKVAKNYELLTQIFLEKRVRPTIDSLTRIRDLEIQLARESIKDDEEFALEKLKIETKYDDSVDEIRQNAYNRLNQLSLNQIDDARKLFRTNRELLILEEQQREDSTDKFEKIQQYRLDILRTSAEYQLMSDTEKQLARQQIIFDSEKQITKFIENEAKKRLQIEADAERAIQQVKAQGIQGVAALAQATHSTNEGIANALLAVEKGLRIADVIVNAKAAIAKITAAGAVRSASLDPTAQASMAKNIALVKGSAAISIAAILAQGLGKSKGVGGGNGGVRGAGGGGNTGGRLPSPESGFSTGGEFMPQSPERYQTVNINVENRIDRRGLAFLVKGGNADISSSSVTTRSR